MATIHMKNSRIAFLVFVACLFHCTSSGQGVSIRSSSGKGTNLSVYVSVNVNGTLESTNGKIVLGDINGPNVMTNYNQFWQRAQLVLNDSGNSILIRDGAFIDLKAGSAMIVGSDATTNRIHMGPECYITSPTGPGDNNEIFRYRFYGDTSVNLTNRVMRFWEMSNYVASVSPSAGGAFPQLQFKDTGGVFAGTTNLTWDSTNSRVGLNISGARPNVNLEIGGTSPKIWLGGTFPSTNEFSYVGLSTLTLAAQTLGISNYWRSWRMPVNSGIEGSWTPAASNAQDVGSWDFPVRTNHVESVRIGSTLTFRGSGMFLRTTNMWFDGGVSTLYSNVFTSTSGGLTNILATNILDGQSVHLWFFASNGVTVNFPQFVDSDYPDGAVVSPNTNCWTHVIIDRRNTVTNIQVLTAGFTLAFGNFTEGTTNYASKVITFQSTTRTTNYATGALTINCATDVRANITNQVASNFAITLATPVLFTSGSLSLVSDGSARTLAILCPSSTITWMSTNYTANATNILTSNSKRSIFCWRNQLDTDGVTTNTACWVVNQSPP